MKHHHENEENSSRKLLVKKSAFGVYTQKSNYSLPINSVWIAVQSNRKDHRCFVVFRPVRILVFVFIEYLCDAEPVSQIHVALGILYYLLKRCIVVKVITLEPFIDLPAVTIVRQSIPRPGCYMSGGLVKRLYAGVAFILSEHLKQLRNSAAQLDDVLTGKV